MTGTWSAQVAHHHAGSDRPAVVGLSGTWSGQELLERSAGAADWLAELDLERGRPLPALLGGTASALALSIGGATAGHPLAPFGVRLTAAELAPSVAALGAPVLIADPEHAALADEVAAQTGLRAVRYETPPRSGGTLGIPGPDDIAYVLHTSGTTGAPKAVGYRQRNLLARTRMNGRLLSLGRGKVYMTASPFHHIAGLGNLSVGLGAGAGVLPVDRFSVDVWTTLMDLRPTHVQVVPTMVEMLLDAGVLTAGSLEVLMYGAAPIHPQTVRRLMDTLPGVELIQLFGQTEGSPVTCLDTTDHARGAAGHEHILASVGRAVPGLEMVIADPGPDGVGEVCARADHLFRVDDDGWLRTGDLGRVDDEGYLYLSGRLGDMIVRGGENVYPSEVENVLALHPAVREVSVTGVPDRRLGETVAAFVVPASADFDEEDLRRFARDRLAGFKVPAHWCTVTELPRNATGKVVRRVLRDRFNAG